MGLTSACCADVIILTTCLFHDLALSSYLAQNLVELDLVAYEKNTVQQAISLDCISILHKLEQVTMRSSCRHSHWQTQGELSSLTSLHTFKFKANTVLHGDIIPSFCHLPSLAHLECNTIPGGRLELGTGQFTALKSFSKGIPSQHNEIEVQPVQFSMPAAFNSQPSPGDILGSLRSFCVHECLFTSAPVPFWQLSSLTSIAFYDCRFEPEDCLDQILHGAVQIAELIMSACELENLSMSVCQLTNLQSLKINDHFCCDFPSAFSTLTALTMLDLSGNDLDTVLPSLAYLSKLQHVELSICASISSSLLFFLSFSALQSITMVAGYGEWEGLSLYYIGHLEASLEEHFAFGKPIIQILII